MQRVPLRPAPGPGQPGDYTAGSSAPGPAGPSRARPSAERRPCVRRREGYNHARRPERANLPMASRVSLFRWDELDLEKVTEMIARKVVVGDHHTVIQAYLKKGALVPVHAHPSE